MRGPRTAPRSSRVRWQVARHLFALALVAGATRLGAAEVAISWNPTEALAGCAEGDRTRGACGQIELRPRQVLVVKVSASLPGLFKYTATMEDQTTETTPASMVPWPTSKPKSGGAGTEAAGPAKFTVLSCSKSLTQADVKSLRQLYVSSAAAQKLVQGVLAGWKVEASVVVDTSASLAASEAARADCEAVGGYLIWVKSPGADEEAPPQAPAAVAYGRFTEAAHELEAALNHHDTKALDGLARSARAAEGDLSEALKLPLGSSAEAVAAALEAQGLLDSSSKADFVTKLGAFRALLRATPASASEQVILVKEFGEQDFTLRLQAEPTDRLPGGVKRTTFVRVSLRHRWSYSLTSGIVLSGLVDGEYGKKTVVDSRNPDGTPKTTHNELVAQERDSLSTEAALLGALFPVSDSWAANLGLVLGVGLGSGTSTRYYGGLGYRLGRTGLITVGAATGKVKVLKQGVTVEDSGALEPADAVRDRQRTAFFAGLSIGFSR